MDIQIKDGNIVITMPFDEKGTPSGSGKNMVHATTKGNKEFDVKGSKKKLTVGVNVYSSKD